MKSSRNQQHHIIDHVAIRYVSEKRAQRLDSILTKIPKGKSEEKKKKKKKTKTKTKTKNLLKLVDKLSRGVLGNGGGVNRRGLVLQKGLSVVGGVVQINLFFFFCFVNTWKLLFFFFFFVFSFADLEVFERVALGEDAVVGGGENALAISAHHSLQKPVVRVEVMHLAHLVRMRVVGHVAFRPSASLYKILPPQKEQHLRHSFKKKKTKTKKTEKTEKTTTIIETEKATITKRPCYK